MFKRKKAVTAALAVLMALPVSAQAQETDVKTPGPFKARIIEMLRDNPFSMYWDGTPSDAVKLDAEEKPAADNGVMPDMAGSDFWEPAPAM